MGKTGKKRKGSTPVLSTTKKGRPYQTGPQRDSPPSPTPSTDTVMTFDSTSTTTSTSSSTTSDPTTKTPKTNQPTSTTPPTKPNTSTTSDPTTINPKTDQPTSASATTPQTKPNGPKPPPIIISSAEWRKSAPSIYKLPDFKPQTLTARTSQNGKITLQTTSVEQFRLLQKNLSDFHTFNLPEDRTLKVVLKGVPTDVTDIELTTELESLNYSVKYVRRFGTPDKPMPMCLVHISASDNAKDIFNLTSLFYITIKTEPYQTSGPAQCYKCQRYGHGSSNCGHPPRCVKCANQHTAKECPKTREQPPKCCNCGGSHTANYRGCPDYVAATKKPSPTPEPKNPAPAAPLPTTNYTKPPPTTTKPITPPTTHSISYANVTKNSPVTPTTSTPQTTPGLKIDMATILNLLTNLLTALSTDQDPRVILQSTIQTFLTILTATQNG